LHPILLGRSLTFDAALNSKCPPAAGNVHRQAFSRFSRIGTFGVVGRSLRNANQMQASMVGQSRLAR